MALDAAVPVELPVPPGACDVVVTAVALAAPAAPAAPAVVVVEGARSSPKRLKKGSRGEEKGEEKPPPFGSRSSVLERSNNVC